ncbi:MAG: YraN family protein [Bacteroides sp.]|nr:YraN family protein [Bacteroides sp.]MBD5271613.1 YraN family protein [Bacteroides sp.]MBD5333227.1 YraN family protein [Bacteroides sp.]
MAQHNLTGKWGEQIAMEHLLASGYTIEATNVRIGKVEIDIVARKDDRIIFVEVKTRSSDYVDALTSIDAEKTRRLLRAADTYMRGVELSLEPQIDLIFIVGTPETGFSLEHIPDAIYP